MTLRTRMLALAAVLGSGTLVFAPMTAHAQTTPKVFFACYVPNLAGTLYRIKEPGLRSDCLTANHVQFNWTDGVPGAAHGALNGLSNDDHPQYLLASGARPLAGSLGAGGFKITALGAGTTAGDAVRFEQVVKVGDAAGGDLLGTYPNPSVAKLQGQAVSSAAPTSGQVLTWNGSVWAPTTPAAGSASATSENMPNTLVQRDGLGGFRAGAITGVTLSTPRLLTTALGVGIGGPDGDGIVNINARDWGVTSSGEMTGKSLGVTGSITSATLSTPRLLSTALGVGIGGPDGDGIVNINARDWGITSIGEMTGKSIGVTGSITGGLIASTSGGFRFPDGTVQTTAGGGGGASDHGLLGGLTDDDHPQYLLGNNVRATTNGFAVTGTRGIGTIPTTGAGTRLMWHPRKAAFRAGNVTGSQWDDANVGDFSTAMGSNTTASGENSTALGDGTTASGRNSVALGNGTIASGENSTALGLLATASGDNSMGLGSGTTASGINSTALGDGTTASGQYSTALGSITTASGFFSTALGHQTVASDRWSTAMGFRTTASGEASTALGYETIASGENSTAIGVRASANGHDGSFVYGDASTHEFVEATAPNSFVVRAAGGFRFRTASDLSTGCDLPAGSGSFACTSDRNRKDNFRDEDGEHALAQIAGMPLQSWNYKAQDPAIRHLGPTAQDFYAAFHFGESDTTISTVDADGVALLAIQALERRTRDLDALRAQVAALVRANEQLRAELTALRTGRAAAPVRAAQ